MSQKEIPKFAPRVAYGLWNSPTWPLVSTCRFELLLVNPHANIVSVYGICTDHPDRQLRIIMKRCLKSVAELVKLAADKVRRFSLLCQCSRTVCLQVDSPVAQLEVRCYLRKINRSARSTLRAVTCRVCGFVSHCTAVCVSPFAWPRVRVVYFCPLCWTSCSKCVRVLITFTLLVSCTVTFGPPTCCWYQTTP